MRTLLLIFGMMSFAGCGEAKLADSLNNALTCVRCESSEFESRPIRIETLTGQVLPQRRYNIVAPTSYPVVYARSKGERLGRGEIVMQFSTDQLALEKRRLEQALLVDRENRALRERMLVVENQIASSLIRAPFDMVIASNSAVVGNQYNENAILLEGVEEGAQRVAAQIPRWFAEQTKKVSNVDLVLDGNPARCLVEIESAQSQNLSSLLGYLTILSDFASLQPNQKLEIEIQSKEKVNGYWFPTHAVRMDSENDNYVFVVEPQATQTEGQTWFVKKMPVNLISRKDGQVFGQASNLGPIQFVSDGTHRVVGGQQVELAAAN